MSVSYNLFDALRSFDNVRRENRSEYLSIKKNCERFKGSSGYDDDMKKAKAKRKAADDAARDTASKKINECLQQMRENIKKVAFVAPSPEQVSILQILALKSKVSKTELDRAAQSMNGNSLALSALNDIADKHYFVGSDEGQSHTNYNALAADLSETALNNYISSIVTACKSRLQTSARDTAYQGARFQAQQHGIKFDEDDLPQKDELVSERQFYGGIVAENHYDSFMKAVNG